MQYTKDFENNIVIVTGSAGGLGKETAIRFAGSGAKVVIADIKRELGERTAQEIRDNKGDAIFFELNVTDDASVNQLVEKVIGKWDRIDVLVNCAGISGKGFVGFDKIGMGEWDVAYDVNVKGIMRCVNAVAPVFKKNRHGKIINVASISGRMPTPGLIHYAASKASVINLSQTLAVEMARFNVNVNTVCPGWIWTPIYNESEHVKALAEKMGQTPREFFLGLVEKNCPLKREQTEADIANVIMFLASESAKNITGQAINVDGGAVMS